MSTWRRLRSALIVTILLACGAADETSGAQPKPADVFGPETSQVIVEVDYAAEAEPYVGSAGRLSDIWQLTYDNLTTAFGPSKTVTVPRMLQDMERLDDVRGEAFDADAILAIAERHRSARRAGTVGYYVVFLPGRFARDGVPSDDTLGVSIAGTGVIAMFKEVIAATSTPSRVNVARFTEQIVLVHELGHALGLVNNGLPLTSAHHDVEHGAHCTNRSCIMYYANEGVRDVLEFARTFLESGSTTLFASECLEDLRAARGD